MVTTTSSVSANMIQSNNISPTPNITTTSSVTSSENSIPTRRVGENRRVSILKIVNVFLCSFSCENRIFCPF